MPTMREFLSQHVLLREEVDRFLDPDAPNWGVFDPELGYLPKSSIVRDGMDGAYTIASYVPAGERRMINWAGRPCRMNCYGDSFTQCQQVSDAETWEEYLAGHLGEPIRNFGVGGYGLYQAYRRMKREEAGPKGVPYIILGIYAMDDHCRSLDAWRRPRCGTWFRENPHMFHANPWDYVRFDPDTLQLTELPNLCPTPESLYRLCDEAYVYETFSDDLSLNLCLGEQPGGQANADVLRQCAESLAIPLDLNDPDRRHEETHRLYMTVALRASMQITQWAQAFADTAGKKLLLLLMYDVPGLHDICSGRPRDDQAFVDFLNEHSIQYIDMWTKHSNDYAGFALDASAYISRYCIPHYNPLGNHFMAYAIKDELVNWLDPKPAAYPQPGESVRFRDYLAGA